MGNRMRNITREVHELMQGTGNNRAWQRQSLLSENALVLAIYGAVKRIKESDSTAIAQALSWKQGKLASAVSNEEELVKALPGLHAKKGELELVVLGTQAPHTLRHEYNTVKQKIFSVELKIAKSKKTQSSLTAQIAAIELVLEKKRSTELL